MKLRARPGESPASSRREPSELRIGKRPLPVRLVALTEYRPGARWRGEILPPGQALLAVMEHTLLVRNRPEATLRTLKEVVTRAPVIKGVRGEVEEAVERLLSQALGSSTGMEARRESTPALRMRE